MDVDRVKVKREEDEDIDVDEYIERFNATELIPYINKPHHQIPHFKKRLVALVREWVSDKVYEMRGNEEYEPSPECIGEPWSLALVKSALVRCMTDPSQMAIETYKDQYIADVIGVRDVFVEWFYTGGRFEEINACFAYMTVMYDYDSKEDRERKIELISLGNKIAKASERRAPCINSLNAFIAEWTR